MKKLFEILVIISLSLLICSMRKIGSEYCRKADPIDMVKVQKYDTLERFSEFFNFNENCWTSEQIIDETYFQMDIPIRDNDIKMRIEFRYGRIQKLDCFMKDIKIPCDTIDNPKIKLNNNLQALQKYTQRSR